MSANVVQIAEWRVYPQLNRLESDGESRTLEPKVMDFLVELAQEPGEVVSREALLDALWPDTSVGEEALTYAIGQLRKAFDDDAREPRVIETIPRRGYRLIANVTVVDDQKSPKHWRRGALAAGLLLVIAAGGWFMTRSDSGDLSEPVHVQVVPEDIILGALDSVALSPDGRQLAFTGIRDGELKLWIRPMGSSMAKPMPGTIGALSPFWSPDSRFVAFFT